MRRRTLVEFDLVQNELLIIRIEVGELHSRAHLHPALIYQLQQLGDEVGEADITTNSFSTFTHFRTELFVGTEL